MVGITATCGESTMVHITVNFNNHEANVTDVWASVSTRLLFETSLPKELRALTDFYHQLGHAINDAQPGLIYPLPEEAV